MSRARTISSTIVSTRYDGKGVVQCTTTPISLVVWAMDAHPWSPVELLPEAAALVIVAAAIGTVLLWRRRSTRRSVSADEGQDQRQRMDSGLWSSCEPGNGDLSEEPFEMPRPTRGEHEKCTSRLIQSGGLGAATQAHPAPRVQQAPADRSPMTTQRRSGQEQSQRHWLGA